MGLRTRINQARLQHALKKAQKNKTAFNKAQAAEASLSGTTRDTHAAGKWRVRRAAHKTAKAQTKITEQEARAARIRANIASAKVGLPGTRAVRTKFWEWRHKQAVKGMMKKQTKVENRQKAQTNITEAFARDFDASRSSASANTALAKTGFSAMLQKLSNKRPQTAQFLEQKLNFVETMNRGLPLRTGINPAALTALRAKILAETANADARTGAYRLLEIEAGLAKIQNELAAGRGTEAQRETDRLNAFNENAP